MLVLVFLLLGGVAGFTTAQPTQQVEAVTVAQFVDRAQRLPGAVVLDVRRPGELTRYGSWPSARNLDYTDASFRDRLSQLDRQATYLVYCASGGRASLSANLMRELGFRKVFYLADGGWSDLQEARGKR